MEYVPTRHQLNDNIKYLSERASTNFDPTLIFSTSTIEIEGECRKPFIFLALIKVNIVIILFKTIDISNVYPFIFLYIYSLPMYIKPINKS